MAVESSRSVCEEWIYNLRFNDVVIPIHRRKTLRSAETAPDTDSSYRSDSTRHRPDEEGGHAWPGEGTETDAGDK
jgi:hypothetical protein